MAIAFYMDVHIPKAITVELRRRGIDVITAQEDNMSRLPDSELLARAGRLNRILFTFDDDLLGEAANRQLEEIDFPGVVFAHPLKISLGACINDLELIARVGRPEEFENRVEYLPL